jgi:DNA primase
VKYKPVTWTTRAIGQEVEPRYLSAIPDEQSVDLKHTLYSQDYTGNVICVVEGPLDVMRIGPGAVATYGTAFSGIQVCMLSRYPKRVVCFDGDDAGKKAAEKLCRLLEPFPGETLNVELSTGKDPGECAEWEVQELREMLK